MERPVDDSSVTYGSFSLLWPIFLLLCLSHFVEVLSCALQGRTVSTEAGMSIFEHSLAFSEAESMTTNSIGLGFGPALDGTAKGGAAASTDGGPSLLAHLTRSQVLDRMNVTPELLLILLISCCNGLWTNLMDVFGKQNRYRLASTSVWGFCYMAAMVWGLLGGSPFVSGTAILRFPTVCIVGFVPHLLILLGIMLCMVIYALALSITAFSIPLDVPVPLRERFALAHENMQGATQISSIRLSRYEDFYAALLRVGYTALAAASEAVFLNEGGSIVARNMTWLEEERLTELQASRERYLMNRNGDYVDNSNIKEQSLRWESGYSREKKLEKAKNGSRSVQTQTEYGVGAFRGAARFYQGLSFIRRIFFLCLQWLACGLSSALDKIGIVFRPQWLKNMIIKPRKNDGLAEGSSGPAELLDFWILNDNGELELPNNYEFDVEMEMRKRERAAAAAPTTAGGWHHTDENGLDDTLYSWWKAGGSWGNQDQSPDYHLPDGDDLDDTTSVISAASMSDWEDYHSDDDDDYGRRTPTQDDPYSHSQADFLLEESLLDPAKLARLLDPQDDESKQDGRILAAHLATEAEASGRIMTRSRYRKRVEREKARVLLSSRFLDHSHHSHRTRKPSPDEELEILEKLILSRRADSASSNWRGDGQTWASGAQGLGPDGPPCVVCQTNPRSIITWPCRCLCICEDCRVSLAMNNFASCVTCRQDVGGFLRLWVP